MTMKDRLESGNMELGVDGVSSRKMKLDSVEVDNVVDVNDRSDSSCDLTQEAHWQSAAPFPHGSKSEEEVTCDGQTSVYTWS